jgi:hypothetical protein
MYGTLHGTLLGSPFEPGQRSRTGDHLDGAMLLAVRWDAPINPPNTTISSPAAHLALRISSRSAAGHVWAGWMVTK